jgi:hypothetical protein
MGTCSRLSTYLATSLSIRNTYDSIESEANQEKYRLVFRYVYSTSFQAPKFNLELIKNVIVIPMIEELILTYLPVRLGFGTKLAATLFGLFHTKKTLLSKAKASIGCFFRQRYLKHYGLMNITPIIEHCFHNLLCDIVTRDFKGIEIISLHNLTQGVTYPREHLPHGVISLEELQRISPEELMALSLSN